MSEDNPVTIGIIIIIIIILLLLLLLLLTTIDLSPGGSSRYVS